MFDDTVWFAKLCYLADIFSKLNELNVCLQGKDTSILNLYDKVGVFLTKYSRGKGHTQRGFSPVLLSSEDVERAPVKSIIEGHLANLIGDFNPYFSDLEENSAQLDWVRKQFLLSCLKQTEESFMPVIRKNFVI